MKIFITGVAGFIGSHLASYHLNRGDEVLGIDNLSTGSESNLKSLSRHPRFRFVKDNLLDWNALDETLQWADRAYHMAARVGVKFVFEHPYDSISENIRSCERILLAASRRKGTIQLLIASSSCVYGTSGVINIKEEAPLVTLSQNYLLETYAVSKITNEIMTLCFRDHPSIQFTIARFFNIIGPNQTGRYGMVVPTFVEQALLGKPITVYGSGRQTRSFCSVHDAIEACDRALSYPEGQGQIFNIGSENEISVLELAELIKQRTKSASKVVFIPYKEAYGAELVETERRSPCIKKIEAAVGYRPKVTLVEAIDEVIGWKKKELCL